jgi:hypothetical protein
MPTGPNVRPKCETRPHRNVKTSEWGARGSNPEPTDKSLSGRGSQWFAGVRAAGQTACAYRCELTRAAANCNPDCNPGGIGRCASAAGFRGAFASPLRFSTDGLTWLAPPRLGQEKEPPRSLMVFGATHPFGGSLSEAFAADCIAVLLCCTAPGIAVKPHGPPSSRQAGHRSKPANLPRSFRLRRTQPG